MPTAKPTKRSTYSLQITPAGLIFSIMVMLVAVLALSSGNNLLYLLVAVLVAILILSLFASRSILSRMDLELRYPERASIGESVAFDLTVRNRRRLFPVLSLTVTLIEQPLWSRRSMRAEQGYVPLLPRRAEAQVRSLRRFARRGLYRFRALRLETRAPFGFFEHRRVMPIEGEFRVHPEISPLKALEQILHLLHGLEESSRKGSGGDLYAIRDSQGRDPHHHIDWKSTARTGSLMVREFTNEDRWQITILLDCPRELPGSVEEETHYFKESGIVFVASLIDHLIERGAEIQVLTPQRRIPFGTGLVQRMAILDLLAELPVQMDQDKISGWWSRIWGFGRRTSWSRPTNADLTEVEGDRDWLGTCLDRQGEHVGGSVMLIVPTLERARRLLEDERITVIACDTYPGEVAAS